MLVTNKVFLSLLAILSYMHGVALVYEPQMTYPQTVFGVHNRHYPIEEDVTAQLAVKPEQGRNGALNQQIHSLAH